jgi:DNA-binding NarL/FixJ family response regulator
MQAATLHEAEKFLLSHRNSRVIINPSIIQNNTKLLASLKNEFGNIHWIAFVSAFYDNQLLSLFDDIITVSDPPEKIISTIRKPMNTEGNGNSDQNEILSDRETEVLKLIAQGLANKEVAEKLNISINTVMTHRKNISQKTGIKSLSGLTIYAVVKKIITLDNLR